MTGVPPTEAVDPQTANLDVLSTRELVRALVSDQRHAADTVLEAAGELAAVADEVARRLKGGGVLHYVGAGSSGRLGALDAAEMPPTFGTAAGLVRAHIAGGAAALTQAIEGAEDDGDAGAQLARDNVSPNDAVVGISASGGAEYVARALAAARELGAFTVAVVADGDSPVARAAERTIVLATGAEALAGSTRMKAGTAQKIALNALSTAVMVRLGKVHDNLMVDVVATNRKLHRRAIRLVSSLAGVSDARATELLQQAGWRVKTAVVMERRGVDAREANALLTHNDGSLRALM